MQIFVRGCLGKSVTLNVENNEKICSVKRKLKEKEGFGSNWHVRMIYSGLLLEDGDTLADYNILKESTLDYHLFTEPSTKTTQGKPEQAPLSTPQTKIPPRPATQTTSKTNTHPIIKETNDIQGSATCADRQPMSISTYESKLKELSHYQAKATAVLSDLMPEFQTRPSSELEDLKRKMSSKERELEATISKLKHENKVISSQHASCDSQIIALKAEDKKTKQELMVARKEQEATTSRLKHKIKLFSGKCAYYESQVLALEAEIKSTKAAAYAEGLKEGMAKRLKSVEFLHHLTDASMQYFDHGFDSCQKQAEQQGFVGKLNKDSALKDAPDLNGWKAKS